MNFNPNIVDNIPAEKEIKVIDTNEDMNMNLELATSAEIVRVQHLENFVHPSQKFKGIK